MTPAAKIVYLGALLLGLSAGLFRGFYTANEDFKQYNDARKFMAPIALRDYAYIQYKQADTEHSRAALQALARLLEEMEMLKPERSQELDLAVAYTRLALIEDQAHNQDQSHADMTEARSWYATFGGRDYSESEMKTMLKTFDETAQRLGRPVP